MFQIPPILMFIVGAATFIIDPIDEKDIPAYQEDRALVKQLATDFCNCATEAERYSEFRQPCLDNIEPFITFYCADMGAMRHCKDNLGQRFQRECNPLRCWTITCINRAKAGGFFPSQIVWPRPTLPPYEPPQ